MAQKDEPMSPIKQEGSHIIHVRSDSDSELQALFDSVLKPTESQRPLQVPLRMRNLPKSFFAPPSTGSKTPSLASLSVTSPRELPATTLAGSGGSAVQVHHSRAHSSPASLQQMQAVVLSDHPVHVKQASFNDPNDGLGPLPMGWEKAKTEQGQVYFLNHSTQSTTWEDPRKSRVLQQQQQRQQQQQQQQQQQNLPVSQPQSPIQNQQQGTLLQHLGPLPEGWEQAGTPEGEVYYINHQTRTTSWFDPRIPINLQRPLSQQNNGQGSLSVFARHQQQQRLQELQERKMLHPKDTLLRQSIAEDGGGSPPNEMAQSIDPFLSSHPRQESADSGLEMGNSYSHPHTPEGILTAPSPDDMDSDTSCTQQDLAPNDLSSLGTDIHDNNMEDLVPTIGDIGSDFNVDDVHELLNSKMDNVLTWL